MACLESSFPEYSILKTSPLGDELDVGECGWYWRIALDHRAALYWRARPDNSLYPKEKGGGQPVLEKNSERKGNTTKNCRLESAWLVFSEMVRVMLCYGNSYNNMEWVINK